jgi:hypothetical protein
MPMAARPPHPSRRKAVVNSMYGRASRMSPPGIGKLDSHQNESWSRSLARRNPQCLPRYLRHRDEDGTQVDLDMSSFDCPTHLFRCRVTLSSEHLDGRVHFQPGHLLGHFWICDDPVRGNLPSMSSLPRASDPHTYSLGLPVCVTIVCVQCVLDKNLGSAPREPRNPPAPAAIQRVALQSDFPIDPEPAQAPEPNMVELLYRPIGRYEECRPCLKGRDDWLGLGRDGWRWQTGRPGMG